MTTRFRARTPGILRACGAVLACALYALPFAVLVALAFSKPGSDVFAEGLAALRPANLLDAAKASRMPRAIWNSAVIAAGATSILVASASMAAFVVARFPGRVPKAFFAALVGSMMIPGIVNTVPLYTMMARLGAINTYRGMILVCATNALPFATFLYAGFVKSIPRALEESAAIDGCGPFATFLSITFPMLKPVTASVLILNGIGIWNNYGQAVFFLQARNMKTAPLAVSVFFQQYGARWNLVAAAAVLALAPAVAVFLACQSYFVKGISAGAVK